MIDGLWSIDCRFPFRWKNKKEIFSAKIPDLHNNFHKRRSNNPNKIIVILNGLQILMSTFWRFTRHKLDNGIWRIKTVKQKDQMDRGSEMGVDLEELSGIWLERESEDCNEWRDYDRQIRIFTMNERRNVKFPIFITTKISVFREH